MHTLEYVCILLHSSMHTTLEYVVYYAYYPLVVHMHVCMYVHYGYDVRIQKGARSHVGRG